MSPQSYKNFVSQIFRHYKGNSYAKLYQCKTPDTREHVVVYRTLDGCRNIWCRPSKMFFDPNRFTALDQYEYVEIDQYSYVKHTETGRYYHVRLPRSLSKISKSLD